MLFFSIFSANNWKNIYQVIHAKPSLEMEKKFPFSADTRFHHSFYVKPQTVATWKYRQSYTVFETIYYCICGSVCRLKGEKNYSCNNYADSLLTCISPQDLADLRLSRNKRLCLMKRFKILHIFYTYKNQNLLFLCLSKYVLLPPPPMNALHIQ